jgi:hypothetical protein
MKTQFQIDLEDKSKTISINGNIIPLAKYNLIVSIRDVSLYKIGMKPNRHWKITDVKKYFGLKGNVFSMYEQLLELNKQQEQ